MTKFKRGKIFYHIPCKQNVEFRYMGKTNLAIVCEPGDSGGGMQSCWGVDPNKLIEINSDHHKQLIHQHNLKENLKYVINNFDRFADGSDKLARSNHLMGITISCEKGEMSFHYGCDPCHETNLRIKKQRSKIKSKK